MKIGNYYEETVSTIDNVLEKLFYAIMYRRWDQMLKIIENENLNWEQIAGARFRDTDITIKYCIQCNLGYLISDKNTAIYEKLREKLGDAFQDLTEVYIKSYDDKRFYLQKRQSAFDVFWGGNQPVLNVTYFEKQTMPAKQVMTNGCSMVLDEVGTGKTVAGIYTIQQVIQDRIINKQGCDVAVLVVCPYNKREDWHNDILRQLGRQSKIVEQSDNGEIVLTPSKTQGVPHIYIEGNKGGDTQFTQFKKGLTTYNGQKWDLVIIDECHECFGNYSDLKANKMLLLTATPIVKNSQGLRNFDDYNIYLLKTPKVINPIENQNPSENDIFVCNFKEDIFDVEINRKIEFVECERNQNRQKWFNSLRENQGFFAAIFADQDDNRLAKKMEELNPGTKDSFHIEKNGKLEKLAEIIFKLEDNKSFLIFCETINTVDLIYDYLSKYASNKLMIGKLHGDVAEIKGKQTNSNRIMSELKNNIRKGNRSIFITTGKSGGTGLNLGEFNAVIHYELPFSSNALEQRFGRIERADDLISCANNDKKTVENTMIFMLNKPVDGERDFETNRMLYYSINKIQVTYKYMPVRNTILFNKDYITRVTEQAKIDCKNMLDSLQKPDLSSFFAYIKDYDAVAQIVNSQKDKLNLKQTKDLITNIETILNNTNIDVGIDSVDSIKAFNKNYIAEGSYEKFEEQRKVFEGYIEYILWLKRTLSFWGISIISDIKPEYDEAFTETIDENASDEAVEEKKSADHIMIMNSINSVFNKIKEAQTWDIAKEYLKAKIIEITKALDGIEPDKINCSGVFYEKNGNIVNKRFDKTKEENV